MGVFKEIDSPVQMRLYTLTKHRFVLVFVVFCIVFLSALIIGAIGPTAIGQHTLTARQVGIHDSKMKTGPYVLNSGGLSQFNEQLWLFCQYQLTGLPTRKTFENTFKMSVQILASSRDTSYKLITHAYQNRSRTLKCTSDSCEPLIIFHLGWLAHPMYLVNLTVYGLSLPQQVAIRNVVFTFKYYKDQFTQIQIWFRFVFLVLSFTVTCLFTHSLRKFPIRDWCIEQRWMSALLPLLLLYNNPLFPLIFLVQSWVPGLLDAIFQVSFFSSLLMFWLCAFHGIRQPERKFISFYLPKLVLVALMWIIGCSILSWQQVNEMIDPSYQYKIDIGNFVALKIFFYIVTAIYVIYLLLLLYKAFTELKNMPYFDVRLKFLTILMLIVVLISLVAVIIRFKSAALISASVMDISSNYENSAEFLAFYALFNLYLYTMAFMYSPSPHAIRDASVKSLPSSFSMVGESDEDATLFERKFLN